jgi:hypothetical protein
MTTGRLDAFRTTSDAEALSQAGAGSDGGWLVVVMHEGRERKKQRLLSFFEDALFITANQ